MILAQVVLPDRRRQLHMDGLSSMTLAGSQQEAPGTAGGRWVSKPPAAPALVDSGEFFPAALIISSISSPFLP